MTSDARIPRNGSATAAERIEVFSFSAHMVPSFARAAQAAAAPRAALVLALADSLV